MELVAHAAVLESLDLVEIPVDQILVSLVLVEILGIQIQASLALVEIQVDQVQAFQGPAENRVARIFVLLDLAFLVQDSLQVVADTIVVHQILQVAYLPFVHSSHKSLSILCMTNRKGVGFY